MMMGRLPMAPPASRTSASCRPPPPPHTMATATDEIPWPVFYTWSFQRRDKHLFQGKRLGGQRFRFQGSQLLDNLRASSVGDQLQFAAIAPHVHCIFESENRSFLGKSRADFLVALARLVGPQ